MYIEFFGSAFVPPTPKEIAIPHADTMARNDFDHTQHDAAILEQLEQLSDDLGFLRQRYFVEGSRSFVVPIDTDESETTYVATFDTMFEGELISYSRLTIGRLIGHRAVRALCLTFDNAILLPSFESVHSQELLHIPAYAINAIAPVE